jgi:amino acid adenylation domain-containing protein
MDEDLSQADWIGPIEEFPAEPVHRGFERHARERPEALAVVGAGGGPGLTYGELDRRANRIARRLRALGVGPDRVVALCLPRSVELVLAVVGVFKAGGAYLPVDPATPAERLAFMLADSGAVLLLTAAGVAATLAAAPLPVLVLDADPFPEESGEPLPETGFFDLDLLSYVIYTSGSTGRPKGTELRHAGLSSLIAWHLRTYGIRPEDRLSMAAGPGFDASVWEVWYCLAAGASLHVVPPEILVSPPDLLAWLVEQRIDVCFLPTPLADALVAEMAGTGPAGLVMRTLLTGGDRLLRRPAAGSRFVLYNHYGPTETTIVNTWSAVDPAGDGLPDLGLTLANMRFHLVDAELNRVRPGEPGEILIGGPGLGRGYLRRPDLTAERFIPDPFGPDPFGGPGGRLYRTGDLARRLPDGCIGFLGRIDHQVKIRGIRIELGEVETALIAHPDVREATAMVREDTPDAPGDRRLIAWVVGKDGPLALPALREFLAERLPQAMVPSAFVFLDALPKNANGKVDRLALPAPGRARPGDEDSYVAPRGETEARLATLWAEVLGVDRVGVEDPFLDLGGHSLMATRIVSRVRDGFGVELPPGALFEAPTVAALAAVIEGLRPVRQTPGETRIPRVPRTGDMPASFAQERLWFLDQLEPGSPLYNIAGGVRITGSLDVPAFARGLEEIVRRHEALRTALPGVDGRPVQRISGAAPLELPEIDLRALAEGVRPEEERRLSRQEARRPFDLARGPLLRSTLLRMDGACSVLFTVHHTVADGWSMDVLVRELGALYRAFAGRRPSPVSPISPLAELPIQYADFAVWQRAWLQGETLERQLAWWRRELAGAPALTELPCDRLRPAVQSFRGRLWRSTFAVDLTSALEALARREGASLFMVLLAGLFALLHRTATAPDAPEDLIVGSPVANRNRSETEGLIGFFANTLALRARPSAGQAFRGLLARVRETALGAYAHQDVPFERVVEELQVPRSLGHNPLFQVLLVLQNATTRRLELPGATLEPLELWSETAKLDMAISFEEVAGGLELTVEYATDLFEETTVGRVLGHLRTVLETVAGTAGTAGKLAGEPELPLSALPFLAAPERAQAIGAAAAAVSKEERVAALRSRMSDGRRAAMPRLVRAALERAQRRTGASAIARRAGGGPAPLSFAQRRLWFLDRMEPGGSSYNLSAALRLTGRVDPAALAASLSAVIRRHASLRTLFEERDGVPVQIVGPAEALPLPVIDLRALPEPGRESRRLMVEECLRPFDLRRGRLVRSRLVRTGEEDWTLFAVMHHIVSDGWSVGILVRESAEIYAALTEQRAPRLPELPVQYPDFALWQGEWFQGETLEEQLGYWRRELAGAPVLLELPTDRPRPPAQSFRGTSIPLALPAGLAGRLRELSRQRGATLFMTLLASFQALLHRYCRQDDILVGSPIAGRNRPEIEGLIGCFVNMLVLRGRFGRSESGDAGMDGIRFGELLAQVRTTALDAFSHQDLPFERLVEELGLARTLSHNPLFQVVLAVQNMPTGELSLPGLRIAPVAMESVNAKFDLNLEVREADGGLTGTAEYAADLFDESTVRRLLERWELLLEGAVADPELRILELPLLTGADRSQLLDAAGTATAWPKASCIHELFEEQAARRPDAAALRFAGVETSYGELNARAEALAELLRREGAGPDVLVALFLERSPEVIVAMLAVLKAGGAYVPLDPGYPAERLALLVEDSAPVLLLTRSALLDRLPSAPNRAPRTLCLDNLSPLPSLPSRVSSPAPENLAYVMYTSGSTGRPKGVAVTHGNVIRLVRETAFARFGPDEVFLLLAPVSFDASTLEIWGPLLNGGTLVVFPPHTPTLEELGAELLRQGVTTLWLTAGLFHPMVESRVEDLRGLRQLVAGGDVLSAPHVRKALAALPGLTLINGYGPTENTTFTCTHAMTDPRGIGAGDVSVPIGRPISNTAAVLLDRGLRPVPPGVPGELCAGGAGLARGYLRRPDLTAERFVPNPVGGIGGERLYRTGDLARMRAGGEIEFLGRIDQQVKIRGFRVEPGEIEAVLAAHPAVKEAAVVVRGAGADRSLMACLVVEDAGVEAAMRSYLRERLPEPMIPAAWIFLEALPLNPNGKVDRRALARLAPVGLAAGAAEPAPPRTPLEERLAAIWTELLGVERIGVHDSFFDLGGHSLLAVRVASKVREAFGVELPLRTLFESPTLAELAARIADGRKTKQAPLRRRLPGERVPLSFGQERLWFLDQLDPGSPAYNIPAAVRLTGRLDAAALAASLGEILRRHEALRTRFATDAEGVIQEIEPARPRPLSQVDMRALPAAPRGREIHRVAEAAGRRPFDLARGPLLRIFLVRAADDEHILALTLHHIVFDGWSLGVFARELAALYRAFVLGRPSPLPEPGLQYADFAVSQREQLRGAAMDEEIGWWKGRLAGAPAFLALPADRPRPAVQRFHGGYQLERLDARVESAVQAHARKTGATPFMVLLAVLDSLLARYTGQTDLVVGTPVAGRDRAEVEGLIGLFLNTLVLRADLSGDPSFGRLLERVRETTLEAFGHAVLPFERLVDELAPERDLSHAPVFQVLFVLQNTPGEPFELPDLTLAPVEVDTATSKFDLVLNATETGDGLSLLWMFNREIYDPTRIARLRGHFAVLLDAALADPAARLSDLPLLTAAERRQLFEWNDTANGWQPEPAIHDLIGAQAARTPDAVALSFAGETLTYGEMWDRSGRVAAHLAAQGVRPDELIGISAERSLEMVTGLLGILRAGAAYVPIDPGYPAERIAFMLEDSGVSVLLDEAAIRDLPSAHPRRVAVDPDSLAYMIYTSGSTGRPKGAMNSHRALRNRLLWMQEAYGLAADDRVLQKTPFSFDVSVWEFFWPLMVGARLVIARPGGHQDPAYLVQTIARERITTLHFVPSMLRVFLEAPGVESCVSIRRVICSGEALPAELVRRFSEILSGIELHNLYGPTEAAVDVTAWPCGDEGVAVPIGRPIANTAIHILDPLFHPVPVGVPGELCIGGVQPARGYHRRPELTAETFVPDPFGAGSRLYRTGDLARWRPDGAIEYLGRIDFQVKIRGLRIELGEIEAALASHPAVRDAVVVAKDARLVAYVVGEADASILRGHLAPSLPEYMIPSAFVFLDAMPLSPNGKVDRKALPEPGAVIVAETERVEPRTALERFLAGLWSEALGVPVGIHDSFFDLGGNSITGAVLVNRLQRELGEIVHVVVIFDAPTVAKMAAHLTREHREAVVRLWGAESLMAEEGRREEREEREEIIRVDDSAMAELRGLIHSLPPIPLAEKNPPALFVLSPPRSGSTLLRVMLGGHPALFSPPELELLSFNTMGERKAAFPGRDSFWLEGVIRAVMEARGCGPDEAKALVDVAESEDWTAQRFYGWLQENLSGRILVDKTPSYALDPAILERAEASFADARYIHLIRHPYGMIRSFEEAKLDQLFFRQPHRFSRRALAELIWLVSHRNVTAFLADVPAERQHWVRFEDLVSDPEGEMRRACAFLGIEYHPDMADPYKEKQARMTDGIYAEGRMLGDVKFHQHRGVEASAAGRWRELAAEHALGEPTWETAVALGYERLAGRDLTPSLLPMLPRAIAPGELLPLSFAQERLWFLDRLEPGTALYNIPVALRLDGDLDEMALETTLGEIVRRHAVLRATCGETPAGPVQMVHETKLALPRVDLSALPAPRRDAELPRLTGDEARRPFDLARGPLFRATLVRLGEDSHAALVTMHHIVSDGWSIGLLIREAAAFYSGGTLPTLPTLPIQYPDFARWQREFLRGEALERQIAYWREALAGAAPLDLPADRPRPPVRKPAGGLREIRLPGGLRDQAAALARTRGASLFMVLLAAFQALLHRLSGQDDLSVGTPVAGRNRAEIENLIGFFVNTLVLRSDGSGDPSFETFLTRTRGRALGAMAHQDVPFERLVEELAPERDLARSPLFEVVFTLQNAVNSGGGMRLELPGVTLSALPIETGIAKFDLTLSLAEAPDGLEGSLEYSRDLFDRPTVTRLAGHFETFLAAALAEPGRPLSGLSVLTEAEAWQMLVEWNLTSIDLPFEPVHRLFEARALDNPGAPAVVGEHGILTYGELNRRANRLAHRLRRQGIGAEDLVALRMPRSPDLVTAALAVLKAGAAYLPIDPATPEERAAYIRRDSGARLLLEAVDVDLLRDESAVAPYLPHLPVTPDRLAYVIYTSGSTGEPKGTELLHGGLANLCAWHCQLYGLGPDDRSALVAGPGFDASVWEIWPCLTAGAALHIPPPDTVGSPPDLAAWLGGRRITVTFLPTPLAEAVLTEERPGERLAARDLRLILTGGDRLHRRPPVDATFALVNHYGPTECTVVTTAGLVDPADPSDPAGHRLPAIGYPIDNTRVYLLDRFLRPVPLGVPGELCVAGASLARGYRDRPALTAERFIPDPFGPPGGRMYRTGDLVRYLPGIPGVLADGEIEFLGRIDHQVKIRGIRIELGEIEAALAPHVREAAVVVREGRLVAYVVQSPPSQGSEALRAALSTRLPEAMIPTGWVFLEALPLTPNGKVDRRALERIAPAVEQEEESRFRTPTEELLAGVWSDLLGGIPVAPRDGFFALGGHSLMAARLTSRVRELFGVELPLRAVFEEPTLAGLAARIDRERTGGLQAGSRNQRGIERRPAGVSVPLSFAQERLWFLDRLEAGAGYGIAIGLRIAGDPRPDLLEAAVNGVVERHEALRTTFVAGPDGMPVQEVAAGLRLALPVIDLAGFEGETEARRLFRAEAARGFDLQRGPLLRPLLVRLGDREHRVLLNLHHIVADGWSAGILVRELGEIYQALAEGRPPLLPPLAVQYGDFALWQRQWLSGETLERQIDWWKEALAGAPTVLELPTDRPRPPVQSFRGGARTVTLPAAPAAALRALGRPGGAAPPRGPARRAPRRHPVHDAPGRLRRPAPPLHRPGRPARGLADRQPAPGRAGAADRPVRQHPRAARPARRPDAVRRAAGPGARQRPGRLRAPGSPLRAPRRRAARRAQPRPHAAPSGRLRAPEQSGVVRDTGDAPRPGAGAPGKRSGRHGEDRSASLAGRGGRGPVRRLGVQLGPLRRRDRRPAHRPSPDAPGGRRRASGPPRGRPAAAARSGAAPAPGGVERHRPAGRRGLPAFPLRDVGGEDAGRRGRRLPR